MNRSVKSMKRYLLRLSVGIICFSLGIASFLVWQYRVRTSPTTQSSCKTDACNQGRREAKLDLSQGRLKYRIYGEPVEWDGPDLYSEHLLKDYGIELVRVAGCVVDEALVERSRGYNETSLPIIESRFGEGVLETVNQRAVAEWQKSRNGPSSSSRHHPHNTRLERTRR